MLEEEPKAEGDRGMDAEEEAARCVRPRAAPRVARTPREPTSEERRLHEITHIPMRPWCRHCMRGRSKDTYHTKLPGVEEVPRIGMDYMFLSEKGVTSKRDEAPEDPREHHHVDHQGLLAQVDLGLSRGGERLEQVGMAPSMVTADLATCGLDSCMLVVKSDQEPAIKEVMDEIARRREK